MSANEDTPDVENVGFTDFGLSDALLKAMNEIGYETPSPIQQQCIPHLLAGRDIIGQAQTGTGKTAAFALPLLDQINIAEKHPQLLILAPTRELAIQVAEAVQSFSHHLPGFHVLPVYGGQSYSLQLRPLKRGVHVIVGTPGRVMDHIKRGTLKLDNLRALVLDEADEMLRMGFIDDVEWVMEQLPEKVQIALFSATMPNAIRKVAENFLNKPEIVKIKTKTTTATTIRQRYWLAAGVNKLDALTRILEVEPFDALLIFVRTKTATIELAGKLSARGFAAEAINGDIPQNLRERTIEQLKAGKIDILVATDVAARGLDVERISHVVNYDIPYDPESYVHRIGRTGRAGRSGEAILFVAPREKRMLYTIEKVTRQPIEPMKLPTAKSINEQRIANFKTRIGTTLENQDITFFEQLVQDYGAETGAEPLKIAAALAQIAQGGEPLLLNENEPKPRKERIDSRDGRDGRDRQRGERSPRERKTVETQPIPLKDHPDIPMQRFKVAVGYRDKVKPGNILGAIANEADLDSQYIGAIDIYDSFSTVDMPADMPDDVFQLLQKTRVCGQALKLSVLEEDGGKRKFSKKPHKGKQKHHGNGKKPPKHKKHRD